ncbi:ankyrin repeat-containing domain protein [Rhypophila decipiens]|uniref:Ankyrin repeat-containing domain protein n=1 Tax=Rhypophila decipiens TaxID=261697 RepID=A0AAN6Y218_9PEZI|nr:ankyrin repeat-containing domain protein [Rhypophila decipiens]
MSSPLECEVDEVTVSGPRLVSTGGKDQTRDTYDYDVIAVGLPGRSTAQNNLHSTAGRNAVVAPPTLRDDLASLIPEGRVLVLDFCLEDLQSRHDYGEALEILAFDILKEIVGARISVKRPITWITHGFAGLVAKKALLIATTRKEYFDIAFRTRSVLFLGTPHFCDSSALWDQVTLYMLATSAMNGHIHSTRSSSGSAKAGQLSKVMEKTSTEFLRIAKLYRILNFVPTEQPPAFAHKFTHLSLAGREMNTVSLKGNFISMVNYSDWDDGILFRFQELAEPNLVSVPDDDYIQLLHHLWTLQESFYLWGVHEFAPEIATSSTQDKFEKWLQIGGSGLFYLFGHSGTGKTSYMSSFFKTLYSPLNERIVDQKQLLISFFHDDARTGAGLFRPMATMLLFQILSQRPHLAQRVHDYWKVPRDTRTTSTQMLLAVFKGLFQAPFRDEMVLVLDGIDDWIPSPLDFLQKLIDVTAQAQVQLKIIVSGERYRGHELRLGPDWRCQQVCLDMQIAHDNTRLAFFSRMIDELVAERPEYHLFRQRLLERFKELDLSYLECSKASHLLARSRTPSLYGTMQQEIELVPGKLEDLYSRIVERSDPKFRNITASALSWILFAERPLTDFELDAAIASEALEGFDMEKLDRASDAAAAAITGFENAFPMNIRHDLDLATDPRMFQGASDHIRIRHSTLKKYLLGRKQEPFTWTISQQISLVTRCLRYLKMFLSDSPLAESSGGIHYTDFVHYASQFWPTHYQLAPPDDGLDGLVIAFLRDGKTASKWSSMFRTVSYGHQAATAKIDHTEQGLDLQLAAECGLSGVVHKLVADRIPQETGGEGKTYQDRDIDLAIDLATLNGHQDIVEFLCSSFNLHGNVSLCNAALGRHVDTLRFLLHSAGAKPDINKPGFEGRTPLGMACLMGCLDIVKLLLEPSLGADLEAQTPEGSTPLLAASAMGYDEIVSFLIEHGANVSHRDRLGKSPIWYAAHWGHAEVVTLLEIGGANVRDVDSKGQGLLHGAVIRSFSGFARFNTEEARSVTTSEGMTALHLACEQGQLLAVQALLYPPANSDKNHGEPRLVDQAFVNKSQLDGRTALHIAAERGFVYTVNMLLAAGANTEAKTLSGYTPLQLAAKEGRLHVMRLLLGEAEKRQQPRPPLLPLAAKRGQFLVVRYLLRLHESPLKPDIRGRTPLALAAKGGHLAVVKLLLKANGTVMDTADFYGWAPLHYASSRGHTRVVDVLLAEGAYVSAIAISNPKPLYKDSIILNEATPPVPMKPTRSNKFPLRRGRYGPSRCTALHLAAMHAPVLSRLLDAGADPGAGDGNGFTALHIAALAGGPKEIELLLDKGKIDIAARSLDGDSALHIAAWNGRCENIRCLLSRGASPAMVDHGQRAALHLAILSSNLEAAKILIAHEDNKKRVTARGNTFLHLAVAVNSIEIVTELVDWGVPIDAPDANGCTPLYDSVHDQKLELVDLLIHKNASVNKVDLEGRTPLHISYRSSRILELLIRNGADVIRKTKSGATPLHYACANGAIEAVQLLIENGADLNAQDGLGQTPLVSASSGDLEVKDSEENIVLVEDDPEMVNTELEVAEEQTEKARLDITKLLLGDERCKPDLVDTFGRTALHIASLNNLADAVHLLCEKLEVDVLSKHRSTPLHFAAHGTSLAAMKVLFQHGADVKAQDDNGATVLHLAMMKSNDEIVDLILSRRGAPLLCQQDMEGCTPLVIATYYQHYRLIKRLAEKYAEARKAINLPTNSGYTPLLIAVENGDEEMVDTLLSLDAPAHCNATATTKDGRTALTLAAKSGFANIVDELLRKRRDEILCILETVWDTLGGLTALQTSLEMHNLDIASTLVREGANVTTPMGISPLFTAALCNRPLMEQMLDRNPRIFARRNGFEELRMAVEAGSLTLWDRFVSSIGIPNITGALQAVDQDGWTLQMIISQSKNQEFQKRLHGLPDLTRAQTTNARQIRSTVTSLATAWSDKVESPTEMTRQWPEIGDDGFASDVRIDGSFIKYNPQNLNTPPLSLRANFPFKPGSTSKTSYFSITIFPNIHKELHHRSFPLARADNNEIDASDDPTGSPTTRHSPGAFRQSRTPRRKSATSLSRLRGSSRSSTLLGETRGSSSSREENTQLAIPCIVIGVCGEFANLRRALPGREAGSFGYHGDDGYFYYNDIAGTTKRERIGPTFGVPEAIPIIKSPRPAVPAINEGDGGAVPQEDAKMDSEKPPTLARDENTITVGCAVCWESDTISFYLNGNLVGERRSKKLRRKLYAVVGFMNGPVVVKVDFPRNTDGEVVV